MSKLLINPFVLLCAIGLLGSGNVGFADTDTNLEQQLIAILKSGASLQEKDAACARLKLIGTAKSVPVIAPLLRDEQLSHSARYALEPMDIEAAGQALIDALKDTSSATKAGIINSLGVRNEVPAVPAITSALADNDQMVACSAAYALGLIAAPAAYEALVAGVKTSSGPLHDAEVDSLLRWGNRLLATQKDTQARALFQQLYDTEKVDGVRVAAYRGLIRSSGNHGIELVTAAIQTPGPAQVAALQVIHELPGREATEALSQRLPRLDPVLQVAVIGGLGQRGDSAALPAVAALVSSPAPEVRLAALRALDTLGSASSVPLLAEFAASGTAEEQRAARQALVDLNRGNVTDALLEQIGSTGPSVQSELTRALGERGDKSAVTRLFALAQNGTNTVKKAAFEALGELAGNEDLAGLTHLVLEASDDEVRTEAAQALRAVYLHLQIQRVKPDYAPLVLGLSSGSTAARIALLPVCAGMVAPELRTSLRQALGNQDLQVRDAAIRTLCDTVDGELLADVVSVARSEQRDNFRVLAISGGVRLATQEETVKISNGQRISALTGLLAAAKRPEEKRLILSGLAEVPDVESLHVVEGLLDQAGIQTEACHAALQIATALPGANARDAVAVLNKALAVNTDPATRKALQAGLKKIQASVAYITDWQVAGPYRQADKDYSALFDIPFPPEMENAQGVSWQPLPVGTDVKRPWAMDLLKPLGGGQECVAYARTWVHCDKDLTARLELGSDDGVRVWVNDKEVYALNVARALKPGSDNVDVNLHSGWNRLLFKVTQHNRGWEFCARFVKPDGSPVEGLRCEAAPQR